MSETAVSTPAIPENFEEFEAWRQAPAAEPEAAEKPAEETSETTAKPAEESKPAPESDPEEDQDQNQERKGGRSMQRRFDALTRKIYELEAALAGGQPAEQPQGKQPGVASPHAEQPSSKPVKPKSTDFASWAEYEVADAEFVEKLTDWKAEQRERAQIERAAEWQHQEQQRKAIDTWREREQAFKRDHADYDDVIASAETPRNAPGTAAIRQALLESEIGPAITYHLAKHPDDVQRILSLDPINAAKAIGRLEAQLSTSATPATATTSRAPKPPSSITSSGKAAPKTLNDPEVMDDYPEWEKRRNAQLLRRRR